MVKILLKQFMKKNFGKQFKTEFRDKNVIKEKGDKLFVNWKGYNNSFKSSIDKRGIII